MEALALAAAKDMFSYKNYAVATETLVFQGCTLKKELKIWKDVEKEVQTRRGVKKVTKREYGFYPPGTQFEQISIQLNLKVYLETLMGDNLGISEHILPDPTEEEMDKLHYPDGTVEDMYIGPLEKE
jgi:hypothetical protein